MILSADATRDRAQFLASGAHAYLTKPIDLRRLLAILDQFLAPLPAGAGAQHVTRASAE